MASCFFACLTGIRRTEFPNFGAGTSMTSEEWWAPIFYKTFLDLDMPKEDVDEVRALAVCHP